MPVSQAQFDQDLAGMITALNTYIAAVDAFIALPPVIDLSNEDAEVATSLAAIQTAQGQIPHPAGPATPATPEPNPAITPLKPA